MYVCFLSVSVANLLTHPELDPDSDGSFTEAEAEVNVFFLYFSNKKHCNSVLVIITFKCINCHTFLQANQI